MILLNQQEHSAKRHSANMNKSLFLLVFFSGACVAIFSVLLSDYIRTLRDQGRFHPLPDIAHLSVIEEKHVFFKRPETELEPQRPREVLETSACEAEALKTLQVAVKSQEKSHTSRAHKLFKHAMVLCPKHPEVLIRFGEFLESLGEDVVAADHLFVRAITFAQPESHEHERALANRRRTSVMVEEIDRATLSRINDKKRTFQRISEHSAAMKRAKSEAYIHHIHHSVGIEGNTMTLAQTRSILETKLAVAGKSIMEHNEVLGLDSALRYINQTLVDKVGEITLQDILEIHKRVIGHVDPIEAGIIRRTQVFVGDYVPPHPSHIDLLMEKFIDWLNSSENLDMHAVRYAALAHYKLVYIHPFVDGNGRTSRLLMNLILMQSGYPPIIIRKQDRLKYYQALVTANEGDIRPFVRFIAECTERTLDAYVSATQENPKGPGLVPFGEEHDSIISSSEESLAYHEQIILGGLVGNNISVEL
ncbi:hypothetical protein TCAL_00770 [Tigriopus californicus]|uniref:Protein adenylyltransferase Fic n=1 Tax=Tigriopus californicus TaxID=6832 RepID=A0A553PA87_TIGCA|nr:protein adenylyltransferase Fic-like [Tigriopus californicus]TRY74605.1 hypothetical protein TCAL_00770 [Tigriopus californicus]|eukprot:TCALIF_00770-PA protein Name:"Similar to CPIJ001789 Adenosine monophosphate-protein transferase FICD homolog (Culex quinquefasciatus)" AED:0.03 eAED:0.03 QI:0/-1/0/1/-1/1/1/0/476